MKVRSAFWDNYKGVLIFLVVLGHFLYSYAMNVGNSFANEVFEFIYIFHMPAFIFCAGYMSKSENARKNGALLKLFVCYIVFNTLMLIFAYFYMDSGIQLLTPYFSYWYILAVIAWRVLANCIGDFKGIVVFSLIVGLLVGFWDFSNMLAIRRIIAFMFFFMCGYKLDKEKIVNFIKSRNIKHYLIGGILAIIGITLSLYLIYHTDLTISALLMQGYDDFTDLAFRCAVFVISIIIIAAMLCVLPDKRILFLTQIGRNSLLIFLVHRFITIIYYKEFFEYDDYTRMFVVYAFIATVITCAILGNERINKTFNNFINRTTELLMTNDSGSNIARTLLLIIFILILCIKPILLIV